MIRRVVVIGVCVALVGCAAAVRPSSHASPSTAVDGNVAWTSLRNRAAVTLGQGVKMSLDWRETAVLRKVGGIWLIDRYHSAPVR